MAESLKNNSANASDRRNSVRNTLWVAVSLSLVCSIIVSGAAVVLKPLQLENELRFRQRTVLEVAGLMRPDADIAELFSSIESHMVELSSGEYVDTPDPAGFDALLAAGDPILGIEIPAELDLAGIRRRARYAPVYLVRNNDQIEQIILPVYGKGLWSTMFGYLALEKDAKTIRGLRFFSHAETPGLGDQIDDPAWRLQWAGKQLYDDQGNPAIEVIRGTVLIDDSSARGNARFQVDGLSGATLTGRGVTQLLRYWTGAHGFGPYLQNMQLAEGGMQ